MNMNGTGEMCTRKPRPRSDLVTELGKAERKRNHSTLMFTLLTAHLSHTLIPQIFIYLASSGYTMALASLNRRWTFSPEKRLAVMCAFRYFGSGRHRYRMAI